MIHRQSTNICHHFGAYQNHITIISFIRKGCSSGSSVKEDQIILCTAISHGVPLICLENLAMVPPFSCSDKLKGGCSLQSTLGPAFMASFIIHFSQCSVPVGNYSAPSLSSSLLFLVVYSLELIKSHAHANVRILDHLGKLLEADLAVVIQVRLHDGLIDNLL